jgi:PKD repeat protein
MNRLIKVPVSMVIFASLVFSPPAWADGNRVGVLAVSYTMNASGSGQWYWDYYLGEPPVENGINDQDQVQLSISGQAKYPVLQTGTDFSLGEMLSSSAQQSVSGAEQGSTWPTGGAYDYLYSPDPNFNPSNACVLLSSTPDASGQFSGTCEENVLDLDGGLMMDGWSEVTWPDIGDTSQGLMCAWHGLDEVCDFQFALTNAARSWSQTLATNTSVNVSVTSVVFGGPDNWSGNATASCTVTLDYAPDRLTANYTANPTDGSSPLTVQLGAEQFDSTGITISRYAWDFGDGKTEVTSFSNCSHIYINAGDFTLGLICTNFRGQTVASVGPTVIHVVQPAIRFAANPTNGPVPLHVSFSCPSVDSSGHKVTEWAWDFGDGATSDQQNPGHTYTEAADFEVSLTVTTENGSLDATGTSNIVVETPTLYFSATPSIGVAPLAVLFTSSGLDNSGTAIATWNWDFGDGAQSKASNPSHVYRTPGRISPKLSAINANGEQVNGVGPVIIVASRSGLVINGDFETGNFFGWSNNDYSIVDETDAYAGNYGADLSAGYESSNQLSQPLTTTPGSIYLLSFWLRNETSTAPSAFSVSWGGTTVWSATNAERPGWTNVQLVVTADATNALLEFDFSGMTPFGLDNVDVENLFIQFTADPLSGSAPLPVHFICPPADDNQHNIVAWLWSFGDGATSTAQSPWHTYTSGGAFLVGLIATNDQGDTLSGFGPVITVTVPTLSFTASPTAGGVPVSVQFTSPSLDSAAHPIMARRWDFGDGTTSAVQNPAHLYQQSGLFVPSLLVTNNQSVQITATGSAITVAGYRGLVLNGGFETGDFTGWTTGGNFTECFILTNSYYAHAGWGAYLGPQAPPAYLSQTLATTPGASYRLSLWLDNPVFIPPNEFVISWDGSTLLDWTNAPAFPWTNLQFTVTASGSETVLQLGFDNGDAFGLDDISVRPAVMPQPAMGGVHASFAGFAINVNNSVAGATYYLLSSTNLLLPLAQWTVVATNCPDGNGGFVIVLPNAISPIPGRFYMLETR